MSMTTETLHHAPQPDLHARRPVPSPPMRPVPVPVRGCATRPSHRAGPSAAAPPDDPVAAELGLLALAAEVCADEVARLLARPTPRASRPGPIVRFVGPADA
jgi:hypothetical protein